MSLLLVNAVLGAYLIVIGIILLFAHHFPCLVIPSLKLHFEFLITFFDSFQFR